jgi:hypothetical protein
MSPLRPNAAVGFLADLFSDLSISKNDQPPFWNTATQKKMEGRHVDLREALMSMIGDEDGKNLQTWLDLYRNDFPAFERLTWDWVQKCETNLYRGALPGDAAGEITI